MMDLVAIGFEKTHEAARVLAELRKHSGGVDEAVVAIRDEDGTLHFSFFNPEKFQGAMWGTLLASPFLNPLVGMVIGSVLSDTRRVLDEFIRSIGRTMQPGTSALAILVHDVDLEKLLAEASLYVRGRIIRSSCSPEREARLEAALCGTPASSVAVSGTRGHV